MRATIRSRALRALVLAACLALGALPASAAAATGDPLFVLQPTGPGTPPPVGAFEGPCGLAVDATGRFYVADYFHHVVDLYSAAGGYQAQLAKEDPLDGPCGLALDATGRLYINNFHRNVVRFTSIGSSGTGTVLAGAGTDLVEPTGVAVSGAGTVYIDERDRIATFDSAGVESEAIGLGSLGEGYGVAVSGFAATAGFVYVPDAATGTVKVYDPATSRTVPVAQIDGAATPPGGFVSLRDAAIAVDDQTGTVYVVDDLTPEFKEGHESVVYAFDATGAYLGRLKYAIQTALPAGLAVDNSATGTQGRVYVTSGYSEMAKVYAYAPGSAGSVGVPLSGIALATSPAIGSLTAAGGQAGAAGTSVVKVTAPRVVERHRARKGACKHRRCRRFLRREVVQGGHVRVKITGEITPKTLPRSGAAPIAVEVGGKVTTTDGSSPPQLKSMTVELNREGRIDTSGLPLCPYEALEPASSTTALSSCHAALVGKGDFEAEIALPGQPSSTTSGRLLAFNGRQGGKSVLFGHIYSPHPFATSFVIVFQIKHLRGRFGTALIAHLPQALGSWGKLTGIELRLDRRYTADGKQHSYLSAGCPAPKGFGSANFPLARTTFGFTGGPTLAGTLNRVCRARG